MRQSASMAIGGELTGRELANVCYGVARSRIPESAQRKALMDVLARAAASRMRELKPQELSNTAWAYATAGHNSPPLFDALAAVVTARLTQPSLDAELSTYSPQELANLCWAFATAGHRHDKLFDALADAALLSMDQYNPQNMANTAWAFATARHPAPRLFDALALAAEARIGDFTPQNLANTVWSFSTAGSAAPNLYNAVSQEVGTRKRGSFKPQELSNMAWAYAAAGHISPSLFDALAEEAAVRGVADFKPQGVARTAWSFSFAGHRAPPLFDALAAVGADQAADFHSANLANTVWAFAMAKHSAPRLFAALGDAAVVAAKAGEFDALELANLAWSFATVESATSPTALYDAIAAASLERVQEFEPQQVGMMTWAFANKGVASPLLFEALGRVSLFQAKWATPRALAATAWAYAEAGADGQARQQIFEALGEAAAAGLREEIGSPLTGFGAHDVASLAWSFAAIDFTAGPGAELFGGPFRERCEALFADAGAEPLPSHLCQLHEFSMWHAENDMASPFSSGLSERCRAAFAAAGQDARPSAGQRWVVSALESLGFTPMERQTDPLTGHCVDIVVEHNGCTIGILVSVGPDDYLSLEDSPSARGAQGEEGKVLPASKVLFDDRSPSRVRKAQARAQLGTEGSDPDLEPDYHQLFRPRGSAALRQRQLERLGRLDGVVAVPFWEWKKLLDGNRFSKAAGGKQELDYLEGWMARALDEKALLKTLKGKRAAPSSDRRKAERAAASDVDDGDEEEAAAGDAAEGPRTWNEFRALHKGKGFSMGELSAMWRERQAEQQQQRS